MVPYSSDMSVEEMAHFCGIKSRDKKAIRKLDTASSWIAIK